MAAQVTLNVVQDGVDVAKQLATGTAATLSQLTSDATEQASAVSGKIKEATLNSAPVKQATLSSSAFVKKDAQGDDVLEFAVWAEAPEDQQVVLECIVNELSLLADVPSFRPHVCLWRATLPITSDPDVLIAEVENAINEWKATVHGDAVLRCEFAGVEERRGSLVALLQPTPQLQELHNWIHASIEGVVGLEAHPFEPHVCLLKELTTEDPTIHLIKMAEKGWLDDVDSAVLQVDHFEPHKLYFAQAAEDEQNYLWLALREFDI